MAVPASLQHRMWGLVLVMTWTLPAIFAMEGVAADTGDPPPLATPFDALDGVSSDELAQMRGRENINLINVQSLQDLKATASGNSVNAGNVISGPITIESHAIDSFDGVGLFNIMTGHNNAVTSAVGISIYFAE